MGAGYLADTNVIIDFFLGRLPDESAQWLDRRIAAQQLYLSVINRIELLVKTEPAAEHKLMQQFVQSVPVLPVDEPVIWETIRLRQQQRVKKLPDAMVAATAQVNGLVLLTRNTSDFKNVIGLTLLDLHDAAQLAAIGLLDQDPSLL